MGSKAEELNVVGAWTEHEFSGWNWNASPAELLIGTGTFGDKVTVPFPFSPLWDWFLCLSCPLTPTSAITNRRWAHDRPWSVLIFHKRFLVYFVGQRCEEKCSYLYFMEPYKMTRFEYRGQTSKYHATTYCYCIYRYLHYPKPWNHHYSFCFNNCYCHYNYSSYQVLFSSIRLWVTKSLLWLLC